MNNMQDLTPKLNYIASLFNPINPSKNGPYSDGWFVNGVKTNDFDDFKPVQALDNGMWYTYGYRSTSGDSANPPCSENPWPEGAICLPDVPGSVWPAQGAWKDRCYKDGLIDTTFTSTCPLHPLDALGTDCYLYTNGVPRIGPCELKNGPYSDGWFVDGVADWEQSPPILHQAIDNGLWYTYGFATVNPNPVTQSPCDFYQSTGAEVIGHFDQEAGYLAQGAWSTGFYVNGVKSTTFNSVCPLFMYDDNNCYTFVNGNPVLATCQIAPQ